ncbi:MAG TPA: hypoxanthine-guanine phosphoribosyltransferase [Thioalkalivibrio sp.]|nr:hypoxanthine-guanine phosphoribosyltransferase [Thioalkalivibrio sp.]
MSVTPEEAARVYAEADCLVTGAEIEQALERMARAITEDLADANPLVVCIMTGGLVAAGQLLTRLEFPLQLDYLHATRYRGATSGGAEVHWLVEPHRSLDGRNVLLVDDILDEGHTLAAIQAYCHGHGAESVRTAVLVDKRHDRKHPDASADYIGVEVADRYLFGSGMDYKEYLRNAAGIWAVKDN